MYSFRKTPSYRNYQILFKRYAHTNYYNTLGLTPKATQTDIKKAYYDLSLKHHPDKKDGSQERFQEIVSAYEVLGNIKTRRLYDRGQGRIEEIPYGPSGRPSSAPSSYNHPYSEPEEFQSRFYRQQMPTAGRNRVYNFDEWQRNHYESLKRRDTEAIRRRMERMEHRSEDVNDAHTNSVFFMFLFLIAVFWVSSALDPQYDEPRRHRHPYEQMEYERRKAQSTEVITTNKPPTPTPEGSGASNDK